MLKQLSILPFCLVGLIACGDGESVFGSKQPMPKEKAEAKLEKMLEDVDWTQNFVQRRANIQLTQTNLLSTLPEITEYPIVAQPTNSSNAVVAELFVSSEKSGKGTDGWMREAADDFNSSGHKLSNGKAAKIAIRKIASGTGYQFIAAGKYLPDGYSPSNHLWVEMVKGHGVKAEPIMERTVGNVAGVVMKKDVTASLRKTYPKLAVADIIDAVVQGKLVMGYTNPYASSTGLNFLVSILDAFSQGDVDKMLSAEVVSAFESFQRGVPFVAMTTLQMRDSVQNNGVLDAFVMEYQTFAKTQPPMSDDYEFIPFGIRHDNPLYTIGDISSEKKETLQAFAKYITTASYKRQADEFGFNQLDEYKSAYAPPPGASLIKAQNTWKEKKDAGRPVTAIFLADTSGSMAGDRMRLLKQALLKGSDFISTNNRIGLVTFNESVNVSLPPKEFDLIHKSAFYAAVEDLQAGGNTGMYNGILVSLSLLADAAKAEPNIKPALFVLTDGETNRGYDLRDTRELIQGLRIPVYTIGYAENISELKELSSLVEAASRNAAEGNIEYAIGSLLNAQM